MTYASGSAAILADAGKMPAFPEALRKPERYIKLQKESSAGNASIMPRDRALCRSPVSMLPI